MNIQQQRGLNYPKSWTQSSIETYERLHDMGMVDQAHIDYVEAQLVAYRSWREWYAANGGSDANLPEEYVA